MNITERAGLRNKSFYGVAGRHADGHGHDLEPGFAQRLRRRAGILLAQIDKQQVFARADPPRDGLADRTRTYNYGTLFIRFLPFLWVMFVSRR
jgi:hypothetical protein